MISAERGLTKSSASGLPVTFDCCGRMEKQMDFGRLEYNIVEMLKEEQIKLGYQKETVRLYYPLSSVCRFLGSEMNADEMQKELAHFSDAVKERLGNVTVDHKKDRFCFMIPPEGAEYVRGLIRDDDFLVRFIGAIREHECTIEDLKRIFCAYSDHVHYEKCEGEDYDYLLYFEDGRPDDFRYCITDEGIHLIYHRFSPEDFEELN